MKIERKMSCYHLNIKNNSDRLPWKRTAIAFDQNRTLSKGIGYDYNNGVTTSSVERYPRFSFKGVGNWKWSQGCDRLSERQNL
ncbi:hypothetical protein H1P_1330017 [Hyella patelloides LEGE 07179]|uniref:Uncharacterized protein n=1 Tax=Hyella patelloides LEGE 07179 TaxID=945734 RepID=A0A563VL01_9CYAN|nr:hypothetical protein H1P_1330017 [Hyella patelloides LEGE 07179]